MANLKLGKLPAKVDARTIKLSQILKVKLLPDLPEQFSVDYSLGGIYDNRMFLNNKYGNCVIAMQAHHILRFEKFEQKKNITIADKEVEAEYFRQTGGLDSGLVELNSLKEWRKTGWVAGGNVHNIYAFASVEWQNHTEVKHCIHLLGGLDFGMKIYQRDEEQFKAGEIWTLETSNGDYLGGHAVYLFRYQDIVSVNNNGITCMTWGGWQFMTWDFWDDRVDEAYGIVDNRDNWLEDSPVDVEKLGGILKEITGDGEVKSDCPLAKMWVGFGNGLAWAARSKTRIPAPIRKL